MTLSNNYKRLNENSGPSLQTWLKQAEAKLKNHSSTPRLDAQIIAGHILKRDKPWLLVHDDKLRASSLKQMDSALAIRQLGVPMAYVFGEKEFYGRKFVVNFGVLVPRPETEEIIEMLKKLKPHGALLDIGTGAGIIAITAALEWPNLLVSATDISKDALLYAKTNAKILKAKVSFKVADLLYNPPKQKLNFITANLPYVDKEWDTSGIQHEPTVAIFAGEGGLALIKKLISQAPSSLKPGGYLLLEADPRQHDTIITLAHEHGLQFIDQKDFALVFQKTIADKLRA